MAILPSRNRHPRHHQDIAERPALSSDGSNRNEKTGQASRLEHETDNTGLPNTSDIDPVKERKLLRKIDVVVVPCKSTCLQDLPLLRLDRLF